MWSRDHLVIIAPLRGSVFIKGQGGLLIGKRGGRGEPVIMEFLDAPLLIEGKKVSILAL